MCIRDRFQGFGEKCAVLEEMPENFEMSDQIAHANLCGFGKSVIQAVLEGKAEELVLVNCCDSMRRVYDIVESTGKCKFLYMLDIPHDDEECEKVKFAASICRLKEAYEEYSGKKFDKSLFLKAFEQKDTENKPYIGVQMCIRDRIDINQLLTASDMYEIDHIIPLSISFNDSRNNKVLRCV